MDSVELRKLDRLFGKADAVLPLRGLLYTKMDQTRTIGLRHDVDDRGWDSVLDMARWENRRNIRSTWYFLHSAPYWGPYMKPVLRFLAEWGHEIGIHNNAIAESYRQSRPPGAILARAIAELSEWSGEEIKTTAAHGDQLCHELGFVNYDMFVECQKPDVKAKPHWIYSLADFGLEYAGDWLPRAAYMSDSGGVWADYPGNPTLDDALREFPYAGRMIVLQHPDWWPKELYL